MLSPTEFVLDVVFPAGRTTRSGWEDRDVKDRLESVLEHGGSLGLFAVYTAQTQGRTLDIGKLLGMALVHDIHEAIKGDRAPSRVFEMGKTKRERRRFWQNVSERVGDWVLWETRYSKSDRRDMWRLTEDMSPKARTMFRNWWREFHNGKSREAKFLRQLHPLGDGAKGIDYLGFPENKGMLPINSFLEEALVVVTDPKLRPMIPEQEKLAQRTNGGLPKRRGD